MQFGIVLSADEPATRPGADVVREYVERALVARDSGFQTLALNHRHAVDSRRTGIADDEVRRIRLQPVPLLARLAGEIGDSVDYLTSALVSPGLHPVQLLEDVVTLNAICHGRFRLGMALGWMPAEFEAFDVPWSTRGRRFDELAAALRMLLSDHTGPSDGEFFQLAGTRVITPYPTTSAPQIWIGASTAQAMRRVARYGDAWLASAHASGEELIRLGETYAMARATYGSPAPTAFPIIRTVYVGRSSKLALAYAMPAISAWYRRRSSQGWFMGSELDSMSIDDVRADRWIIGDPAECIVQIRDLIDRVGPSEIILAMAWESISHRERLDVIRLLGSDVLPAFQ